MGGPARRSRSPIPTRRNSSCELSSSPTDACFNAKTRRIIGSLGGRQLLLGFGHRRRPVLQRVLISANQARSDILLSEDRRKLGEHRMLLDLADDAFRHRDGLPISPLPVIVVVDDQHPFIGHEHADVAADVAHIGARRRDDEELVGELVNMLRIGTSLQNFRDSPQQVFDGMNRNVAVLAASLFGLALGEELWQAYVPAYLTALGAGGLAVGAFGSCKDLLDSAYQYP